MRVQSRKLRALGMAVAMIVLLIAATPEYAQAQRGRTDRGKTATRKTERVVKSKSNATRTSKGTVTRNTGSRSAARTSNNRSSAARTSNNRTTARTSNNRTTARTSGTRSSAGTGNSRASIQTGNTRSTGRSVTRIPLGNSTGSRSGERTGSQTNRSDRNSRTGTSTTRSGQNTSGSRVGGTGRSGTRQGAGTSATRSGQNGRTTGVTRSGSRTNSSTIGSRSRVYIPSVRAQNWGRRSYRATHSWRYAPRMYQYSRPTYRLRWPRIHLHITWPWQIRYRRYWAPRYRYRQVVYVNTTWGSRNRTERVELETYYSHELRYADETKAELDIYVDQIDVYYEGQFLGSVNDIPESLGRIRATVYSDGRIHFDRNIFVLGDPHEGFELISTRYYEGYVVDEFRGSDGYRAGRLDLSRGRVSSINRSRLFNPGNASGHYPISLLPENEGWLWDFGGDAISASRDDYDSYYGFSGKRDAEFGITPSEPLRFKNEVSFQSEAGAEIQLKRESEIQRVK